MQDLYLVKKRPVSARGDVSRIDSLLEAIREALECDEWSDAGFSKVSSDNHTLNLVKRDFGKSGMLGLESLYDYVMVYLSCSPLQYTQDNTRKSKKWIATPGEPPFALVCLQSVTIFCNVYQISSQRCRRPFAL